MTCRWCKDSAELTDGLCPECHAEFREAVESVNRMTDDQKWDFALGYAMIAQEDRREQNGQAHSL